LLIDYTMKKSVLDDHGIVGCQILQPLFLHTILVNREDARFPLIVLTIIEDDHNPLSRLCLGYCLFHHWHKLRQLFLNGYAIHPASDHHVVSWKSMSESTRFNEGPTRRMLMGAGEARQHGPAFQVDQFRFWPGQSTNFGVTTCG